MDLGQFFTVMSTFLFPLLGGATLMATRLTSGETRKFAERQFFASLVVVTLVTLHTVVMSDQHWLIHTVTLASMIVGALVLPTPESSMAV